MSQNDVKAGKLKSRGNAEYKKKKFHKALNMYNNALKASPSVHLRSILHLNKASCYINLEAITKAIECCLESLKIKESVKAYIRLSQCYLKVGKLEKSKEFINKGIDYNLDDGNEVDEKVKEKQNEILKKERKKVSDTEKNLKEGIEKMGSSRSTVNFMEIVKFCDLCLEYHKLLIQNYIKLKKYDNAIDHLNNIWNKFDDKNDLLFYKGKILYYKGENDIGIQNIKTCLKLHPDNKEALDFIKSVKLIEQLKEKGNKLFKEKKFKEAGDVYEQAIAVDENNVTLNAQLYCNKCACMMKLNDYKLAKRAANKAIELDDKYLKAYLRRGTCNIHLEEYEQAVHDFSSAQRIDGSPEIEKKLKQAQELYKKTRRKDYWKILGVEEKADPNLVRKAYKKLAVKYHPDKFPEVVDPNDPDGMTRKEAEDKFKLINEAYQVLSDPQKRRRYEMGFDDIDGGGGPDLSNIFEMFGGGGGGGFPFGGGGGFPFGGFSNGGGGGFHHFTSGGRGGGGGRRRRQQRRSGGGFPGGTETQCETQ